MDVGVRVVHSKIQQTGGTQSIAGPMSQGADGGSVKTRREWTIGKVVFTDMAGDTVQMVRHIFGSPGLREKDASEFHKKFALGTLWRMSNIQKVSRVKPGDEAYSIPWTISYDGSSTVAFKAILQGDKTHSSIPNIMHPGMMIQPLTTLVESRTVSVCGLLKEIIDRGETHNGKVVNFHLVGADKTMIVCAAWRDQINHVVENVGRVVYMFNMWASFKDEGDDVGCVLRCLTTTDSTLIVAPNEDSILEKFKDLVSLKEGLTAADPSEFTLIHTKSRKAGRRDYSKEPALTTCVANLKALTKHPQQDAASQLYVVEAGIARIVLSTAAQELQMANIQTKDGSRIWIDVFLRDFSGGVACKMGEEVALELLGCSGAEEFLEALKKGKSFLPLRSYKILATHNTVEGNVYVNLSVVHAHDSPVVPTIAPPEYTNLQGCTPAEIRCVSKNHFGNMITRISSSTVSSELVLVVLEGTMDATCEQRGDDVFICNRMVKDLMSSEVDPFPISVVSAVPLSSVPSMNLHTGRKSIAVVTDVIMKSELEVLEVHVSHMFSATEENIKFMTEYYQAAIQYADRCRTSRKRQWKDVTSEYVASLDGAVF